MYIFIEIHIYTMLIVNVKSSQLVSQFLLPVVCFFLALDWAPSHIVASR